MWNSLISFKVGGVSDLFKLNETVYLAEPEDIQDYRNGIIQLREDFELIERNGREFRAIAVKDNSLEL